MLSNADLHNLTMDSDVTMRLVARELELARKVVADLRARWPEANVLREYDAGETSEAQPEPRKPSFAAAADAIIRREYAPRAVGVTWSGILDVIERARRASEGP